MNKILCVDDEPAILESLLRVFKNDFEVLTSNDPQLALEVVKKNPDVAVILSDYKMPQMNGVDFLRAARILAPLASRAILSGQIDMHQISDAINHADIHKFIMKPWENDYLRLQILEALQMHNTLREKAHLQALAITDPVTQLTNHRHFQDQLRVHMQAAQAHHRHLTLVIFDVDHFKNFNDRFGHPEGDRLLYHVARELQSGASEHGIVSRYGGEEFTWILPNLNLQDAVALAESVRRKVEVTPLAGPMSSPAYVTLSAGLAEFPTHGTLPSELIEAADRALYQAKRQGRNQVTVAAKKAP